jgi:hypothetical protein
MQLTAMSAANVIRPCAMRVAGTYAPWQRGLIDNAKSRMLLYRRISFFARDSREKRDL